MLLQIAPYFGYLASLFLIIALLVNGDIKFRIYNILGSTSFIIYGVIFSAYPVLLTNVILFAINIYYLIKLYKHKESFDLFEFNGDEKLIKKFLQFYKEDIQAYFPAFAETHIKNNLNFVVLRDLVIANIFSCSVEEKGDAIIVISYTTKKHRDFKVGKYIFEKERAYLKSKGIQRLVYKTVANKSHIHYLKTLGFEEYEKGFAKII